MHVQVLSDLRFLQITTQSNGFVSALNTDTRIEVILRYYQYNMYVTRKTVNLFYCNDKTGTYPTGFYSRPFEPYTSSPTHLLALVKKFFGGCKPLEAILESRLDCLQESSCLELFFYYFPGLNRVRIQQVLHRCELDRFRRTRIGPVLFYSQLKRMPLSKSA